MFYYALLDLGLTRTNAEQWFEVQIRPSRSRCLSTFCESIAIKKSRLRFSTMPASRPGTTRESRLFHLCGRVSGAVSAGAAKPLAVWPLVYGGAHG